MTAHLCARGIPHEVIVAVDGVDGTEGLALDAAAANPSVRVMASPHRRGKGRAVREALAVAEGDVVGFVDADDKTSATHLDAVLERFASGADLVIGDRTGPGAVVDAPAFRRVGSASFALAVRATVGLRGFPDTQCGFKFLRREAAADLLACMTVDGYMFDVELLALAQRAGLRVDRIPVTWRQDRDTRSPLVRGLPGHVVDLWRIRRSVRSAALTPHGSPRRRGRHRESVAGRPA